MTREELDEILSENKTKKELADGQACLKYCMSVAKYKAGDILQSRAGIGKVIRVGYARYPDPEPVYVCTQLTKKLTLRKDGAVIHLYQDSANKIEEGKKAK